MAVLREHAGVVPVVDVPVGDQHEAGPPPARRGDHVVVALDRELEPPERTCLSDLVLPRAPRTRSLDRDVLACEHDVDAVELRLAGDALGSRARVGLTGEPAAVGSLRRLLELIRVPSELWLQAVVEPSREVVGPHHEEPQVLHRGWAVAFPGFEHRLEG